MSSRGGRARRGGAKTRKRAPPKKRPAATSAAKRGRNRRSARRPRTRSTTRDRREAESELERSEIVEASPGATVTVTNKSVVGHNCMVRGTNFSLFGHNNIVEGENISVYGDGNTVRSDSASVLGINNVVIGETPAHMRTDGNMYMEREEEAPRVTTTTTTTTTSSSSSSSSSSSRDRRVSNSVANAMSSAFGVPIEVSANSRASEYDPFEFDLSMGSRRIVRRPAERLGFEDPVARFVHGGMSTGYNRTTALPPPAHRQPTRPISRVPYDTVTFSSSYPYSAPNLANLDVASFVRAFQGDSSSQSQERAGPSRSRESMQPKEPPSVDDGDDERCDEEGRECSICLENKIKALVLPCAHACMCLGCAAKIKAGASGAEPKCPVCRAPVDKVIKIYLK